MIKRFVFGALTIVFLVVLLPASPAPAQEDIELASVAEMMSQYETRFDAMEAELSELRAALARNGAGSDDTWCRRSGYYAIYENVFLTPHFTENVAFVAINGSEFDDDAVVGFTAAEMAFNFDWEMQYTPRILFGYAGCDGLGWRARYWQFDHVVETPVLASDYAGLLPGNTHVQWETESDILLFSLGIGGATPDVIKHYVELHACDFDVTYVHDYARGSVIIGAGIRYLKMDQRVTFEEDALAFNDTGSIGHDFEGVGPTLSLEGRRSFCGGNFELFANIRGTVVFGDSTLRLDVYDGNQANSDSAQLLTVQNGNDLMSIAEMQLGVDWSYNCASGRRLFLRAAVEGQYWFSAGSGTIGIDGDSFANPQDPDMGLFGFTAGAGFTL